MLLKFLLKHVALFFLIIPMMEVFPQSIKDTKGKTLAAIPILDNVKGVLAINNSKTSPYEIKLSSNVYPDFVLSGFMKDYIILVYNLEKGKEYLVETSNLLILNPNNLSDLDDKTIVNRKLLEIHYLIEYRTFSNKYKEILTFLRENYSRNLENNPYYFMFLGDSCINFETTIEKVNFNTLSKSLDYYLKSYSLENESRKFINNSLFHTLLHVVDTLYSRDTKDGYLEIAKITNVLKEILFYLNPENKQYVGDLIYKRLYSKFQEIEINKLNEKEEYENIKDEFKLLRDNYSDEYKAYHLEIISLYNFQKRRPDFYSDIENLIKEFEILTINDTPVTLEQQKFKDDIGIVKNQLNIE